MNHLERVTLVYESLISDNPPKRLLNYQKNAKQLLRALDYLHNQLKTHHGLITPQCLVWSKDGDLKLTHWVINLLTEGGYCLGSMTILPPNLSFIAPEQVKDKVKKPTKSCDIWSAGLTLLKLIKPSCKLPDNPCWVAFCDNSQKVLEFIEGNLDEDIIKDSELWMKFFKKALEPDTNLRGTIDELLSILDEISNDREFIKSIDTINHDSSDSLLIDIDSDYIDNKENDYCSKEKSSSTEEFSLNIHEIYHLWRLSIGRNFESEQRQDDYPPIFRIPYLIVSEKQPNAEDEAKLSSHYIFDYNSTNRISLDRFKTDIKKLKLEESSETLPIVIKEANFAYQCGRIGIFKRLLAGGHSSKEQLYREASVDIPPYHRAQVWANLLNVDKEESRRLYERIDKTAPVATERQISVDIPRCHQYNELMASPQGHQKLARILKAWLNYNADEYVYWQGLDSLASPFLLLNFQDEALAFACFNAFVHKYLRGMFRQVNQANVQQYLDMFSKLLSYHDPALSEHLKSLGFLPDLYAIPWFLTMFTHVLPLHKILHVWDCLILGDEKFPLCIGLAILNQLKSDLMEFNFNDCLGVFSDLPEIDIEKCIMDANHFFSTTPDKLVNLFDIPPEM